MTVSNSEASLRAALERYKFYHIIKLTDEISTPGNPGYRATQELCMKYVRALDLTGKRVLDIGCRDGLFSFAAESLGAGEVIGIDNDLSVPATEFLIPYFQSAVRMEQMNVYDLAPDSFGRFDVVIFPGVLYHLRYPFFALKAVRDAMVPGGDLIIETAMWKGDERNAFLYCPTGQDSPYESTSCTFFNRKGLVDTLESIGFEVLAVEFLRPARPSVPRRILNAVRSVGRIVTPWMSHPVLASQIRRCVIHARFRGLDTGAFEFQYWESTHDFHSTKGD